MLGRRRKASRPSRGILVVRDPERLSALLMGNVPERQEACTGTPKQPSRRSVGGVTLTGATPPNGGSPYDR